MHFGRRLARVMLIAGMVLLAGGPAARGVARRGGPPLAGRVAADSLLLARALRGERVDSLVAALDRDVAAARRAGGRGILARLLRLRGIAHAVAGRPAAISDLDESLRLGEAMHDTALVLVSLRWRAYMAGAQRRLDEQGRLARRLLHLAEAAADPRMQAVAHNFIGWNAGQRGDLRSALAHLEAAVRSHRSSGNETEEAVALTALGSAQGRSGDYDAARASHRRQLDLARRLGNRWLEAQAQTGLGTIESLIGDPIAALAHHRSAWAAQRSLGESAEAALAQVAVVYAYRVAGRPDDALALALEGVAMSARHGYHAARAAFLTQAGWTQAEMLRHGAAEDAWQSVLAMGDSADIDSRLSAAQGLALGLGRAGRVEEMRDLLRTQSAELLPRCSARARLELEAVRLEALVLASRWQEASPLAERLAAEAESLEASGIATWIWRNAALAHAGAGRPERAVVAFERGLKSWESWRSEASRRDWRELRTGAAVPLTEAYAEFLATRAGVPDSARIASAFDLVQRVKSRTLRERLTRSGPRPRPGADAPPVTSRRLREGVLGPGELLLEWFAGRETLFLFASSRGEQRLLRLPVRALRERVHLACGLLGRPPRHDADARAAAAAARELGRELLAGVADLVADARTVVVAPDDFLHEVPFAALELPAGRIRGPLGGARPVVVVPSATVLAEVRERRGADFGRGLLAIGPEAESAGEIAWLSSGFEGVSRIAAPSSRALTPAELAGFGALHFAGHTAVDERFPWRSAIAMSAALRDADRDTVEAPALRAEAIVASRLDARLAVLASCRTLGARVVRGEGVAGLASAFLAAGVPTVIATLWPVEDAATGRLMRSLYLRLSRGESAAAALRGAQGDIRRDRRTRHPWYWAGFVLVGEGGTMLPLRPKLLSPEGLRRRLVPR